MRGARGVRLHGEGEAEDWDSGGNRDSQGAPAVRCAGPMGAGARTEADLGLNGVQDNYEKPAEPVGRQGGEARDQFRHPPAAIVAQTPNRRRVSGEREAEADERVRCTRMLGHALPDSNAHCGSITLLHQPETQTCD
jgi:hypothetical protein